MYIRMKKSNPHSASYAAFKRLSIQSRYLQTTTEKNLHLSFIFSSLLQFPSPFSFPFSHRLHSSSFLPYHAVASPTPSPFSPACQTSPPPSLPPPYRFLPLSLFLPLYLSFSFLNLSLHLPSRIQNHFFSPSLQQRLPLTLIIRP